MKIVGITGGIGSGKSTVCRIFQILNIPIYDADSHAKALMHEDTVKQQIITTFGTEAYLNDQLNRDYMAQQVFSDGNKVEQLNSIVHPALAKHFKQWGKEQSSPYVIKEAAILIESGSHQACDVVVNVSAPITLRIQRIKTRDTFRSETEIQGIIDKQLSDEERNQIADFTLTNDEKSLLIPQVLKLHQAILEKE